MYGAYSKSWRISHSRLNMAKPEERDAELQNLDDLIQNHAWGEVIESLASPEQAKKLMLPSHHWTKFHWLCSIGAAPTDLISLIASLHPEAITMPDNRSGDTPLHIICRNSQTQSEKINSLLKHCRDIQGEGILIRNNFGGTALHSACHHNARLDVLEALVQAEPRIIRVTTHQGVHAVAAMYNAYVQTIPGYMTVGPILEQGEDPAAAASHFQRFWKKVEFLATEYFKQTKACPKDAKDHGQFVMHGLIQCNVPLNMFKLALKRNPEWMLAADASGNLPLHLLVENRPYRLKEKEAIVAAIEAAPQTAGIENAAGDTALVLGIRNKTPWENGLDELLKAAAAVVNRRDAVTGLYPFQLAASVGGKAAIDTTYHLLCTKPDLIIAQ
jgi:ankyrin repeat protein